MNVTKTVNLTNITQEWTFLAIWDRNELTLEGANEIGKRDKNATRRRVLTELLLVLATPEGRIPKFHRLLILSLDEYK